MSREIFCVTAMGIEGCYFSSPFRWGGPGRDPLLEKRSRSYTKSIARCRAAANYWGFFPGDRKNPDGLTLGASARYLSGARFAGSNVLMLAFEIRSTHGIGITLCDHSGIVRDEVGGAIVGGIVRLVTKLDFGHR